MTPPASRSLSDNEVCERLLAQREKCRTCGLFAPDLRPHCRSDRSQKHTHPDGSTSRWLDEYLCDDSHNFRANSSCFEIERVSATLTCRGYRRADP